MVLLPGLELSYDTCTNVGKCQACMVLSLAAHAEIAVSL